jgi:hypothetical protein
VRSSPREKWPRTPERKTKQWSAIKKMDCDEPCLVPNEKMEPIQWTEWPTGALVVVGSF